MCIRDRPNFGITYYVINKAGDYAGVSMYADSDSAKYAVCTENGAALMPLEPLLEGNSSA